MGMRVGPASCACSFLSQAWEGEKSTVVVADASCAPVKGSDTGGRKVWCQNSGSQTSCVGRGGSDGSELPGSRCFGCPPVANPGAG